MLSVSSSPWLGFSSDPLEVAAELALELLVELGHELGRVRALERAGLVQKSQNAERRLLRLDEVADDLVVEVLDVLPGHALGGVLLLLRLERQLDEVLLELLVDVVDAELLEAVRVEDLEAEDVDRRAA